MIWVAWRQFRTALLVVADVLAMGAIFLVASHLYMDHVYGVTVKGCRAYGDCASVEAAFASRFSALMMNTAAFVIVLPALLGAFWGAPLMSRELESGTYRLAWTQGVTRSRWIVTKVGVGLGAAALAGAVTSALYTWWSGPINTINASRFQTLFFDTRFLTPVGYCVFAYGVGVLAGVLWRRTVPAMASALVLFTVVRIAFDGNLRPRLISPVAKVVSVAKAGLGISVGPGGPVVAGGLANIPNAWVYSSTLVAHKGVGSLSSFVATHCAGLLKRLPTHVNHRSSRVTIVGPARKAVRACVKAVGEHFSVLVRYQPAGRFWAFQWYETSIYVVAGIALAALSYWWLRHRVG